MKKRVINLRMLATLLVMLVAASGLAQDSYRETVKEYFTPYFQNYINRMDSLFKSDHNIWSNRENQDLNQLTERYVKERLLDYLTDLVFPRIKELGVSETSFKETMSLLSTPAGKTFREHNLQWAEALKKELVARMIQDSLKIKSGDISEPIQPKAEIDAGYIEKYKEVMDAGIEQIISKYFDQFSNLASMILKEMPDVLEEEQMKLEKVKTWMADNLPTMAMNSAYGILTLDDIDFAAKLKSRDTYKLLDLMPLKGGDLISLGAGIMADYMEWMQNHGAVLQGGFLDSFNRIKQKFGN